MLWLTGCLLSESFKTLCSAKNYRPWISATLLVFNPLNPRFHLSQKRNLTRSLSMGAVNTMSPHASLKMSSSMLVKYP
jgi:hypothetical protein